MTVQLDPMRLAAAERRLLAGVPVRRRRVTLAGIETTVLEGGSGTPLVLLHGPGGGAVHWWRVAARAHRRHRVIAPDLPGQGAPLPAGAELDAPLVLRWLAELVDATCAAPPASRATRLGGALAARFARDHGHRIGGSVLVDALGLAPFAPAPDFADGAARVHGPTDPEATHAPLWHRCAFDLDRLRSRDRRTVGGVHAGRTSSGRAPPTPAGDRRDDRPVRDVRAMPPDGLERIAAPTALDVGPA